MKIKSQRYLSLHYWKIISSSNLSLFSFQRKSFLYFIYSSRSTEIDKTSAYLLKQILSWSKKSKLIKIYCGPYSPDQLKKHYYKLIKELVPLIEEEKRMEREVKVQLRHFHKIINNRSSLIRKREKTSFQYIVYLTRECNMSCRYCWNNSGKLNDNAPPQLDKDKIKKTIDFIFQDGRKRKQIKLVLFGGEPLLLSYGLLAYFFKYTKKMSRKYKMKVDTEMITNGTIWNKNLASLLKQNHVKLIVSIDGNKKQHDPFRILKNGRPSHEIIIKNIRKMRKDLGTVMATACLGSLSLSMSESFDFLARLNLPQIGIKYSWYSSLFGNNTKNRSLKTTSIKKYEKQITSFLKHIIDNIKEKKDKHILSILRKLTTIQLNGHGLPTNCLMGFNQVIIQPDGKIYPCLYFSSREFCIGNVNEGIKNWELIKRFAKRSLYNLSECKECWARHHCGGKCPGLCLSLKGEINTVPRFYCQKKIVDLKAAAYLISETEKIRPDLLKKLRL